MPLTEAQLRASKKYREMHPEKSLEYRANNRVQIAEKRTNKRLGIFVEKTPLLPDTYYQRNKAHLLENQRKYDANKQARIVVLRKILKLFNELPINLDQ